MDIVRDKKTKHLTRKRLIGIALLLSLVVSSLYAFNQTTGNYSVNKQSLLFGTVQSGQFDVLVRGVGVLAAKDIRWVATNVAGKVERILIKAGAQVKKGDLLLELSNPQIVQQLAESQWQLEELEAQVTAQKVNLEADILDQEAQVINQKLNYERAMLTLDAQEQLLNQGVVAVSKIRHAETKIEVEQLKQRWQVEVKRLAKRRETAAAQNIAYQASLKRMQRVVQHMQSQVNGLKIHASMDSTVQEMPLELGQQVNQGSNIARLAKKGEFIAELRVPEKQISDVMIGQSVTVDTRNNKIQGIVKRIDPAVINGSVQVDIELSEKAPKEARPDLTVDGIIEIARVKNSLFVKRPMFAKEMSDAAIYLVSPDGDIATVQKVKFGQTSSKYIQIMHGLEANQRIIISDVSAWQNKSQIKLN